MFLERKPFGRVLNDVFACLHLVLGVKRRLNVFSLAVVCSKIHTCVCRAPGNHFAALSFDQILINAALRTGERSLGGNLRVHSPLKLCH